jgi:hypothetical protein
MNLQNRIDLLQDVVQTYNVLSREWIVGTSLLSRKFTGVTAGADHDMLDAMLLRAPLPKVILIEGENAEYYECIGGHAVLETALDVMHNQAVYEPYSLVRRIRDTQLDVVIFRCNMKREDIACLAKKFYGLNVVV